MLNADKLRGRIVEKRLTLAQVAAMLGINVTTLHRKLAGETEFTRTEIQKLAEILELTFGDVQLIFFAPGVE